MYRVYDNKDKKWIHNILIDENDDTFLIKTGAFLKTVSSADKLRYTILKDIQLIDRSGCTIFESDICKYKNEDNEAIGFISYAPEHAAYLYFVPLEQKYYPLSIEICKYLSVVGNLIENQDLLCSSNGVEESEEK